MHQLCRCTVHSGDIGDTNGKERLPDNVGDGAKQLEYACADSEDLVVSDFAFSQQVVRRAFQLEAVAHHDGRFF